LQFMMSLLDHPAPAPAPTHLLLPEVFDSLRNFAHVIPFTAALLIAGILPSTLRSAPADLPSASKEISLRDYVTELRTASAALRGESTTTIHDFRLSLPQEWVVQADGQSMKVKTDWLAIALHAEEINPASNNDRLRQARQRLAALREAAEILLAPPANSDLHQSHAQVDRILRDREFQGSHEPSWFDKWKARVYSWISRHLDILFGRMGISTVCWQHDCVDCCSTRGSALVVLGGALNARCRRALPA